VTRDVETRITRAIVHLPRLGGQGVLVPGGLVVTAAHCIGRTAEGGMALGDYYIEEIVVADGRRLMASPLAVEPVSDLAELGAVDSQELGEEADAFEDFCSNTKPVRLATDELVHGCPSPLTCSRATRGHPSARHSVGFRARAALRCEP